VFNNIVLKFMTIMR